MKDIDADYYGYMDDDDGILIPLEQKAEQEAREKCIKEWVSREKEPEIEIETTAQKLIPSQQDIQEALLVRKKKELLEKYGLDWRIEMYRLEYRLQYQLLINLLLV